MIPFGPWMPDSADFQTDASTEALNVIPSPAGFRPFQAFNKIASAITARVQGAFTCRSLSGTIYNFCGDATKLYKMDTTGLSWSDVSRTSGGAYSTAADSRWNFSQYGDYVVATNGNDAVQVYQLGVSTNFAALGGSPPASYFTGNVREFGVLAKTSTNNNRIRWSAIGNIADWVSSATTLSDYQDFAEGGSIMGFVGGEFGVVFQERAIQRMSFEGPPTAFRFDKISTYLGCRAENSIAAFDNLVFFLADDGVYMIRGGAEITPIGAEKVDRWIETYIDASNLSRISAAVDPLNKLYLLSIPTTNTGGGVPDTILIYHWPTGQWSHVFLTHELIYTAANQTTYTIDGMDAVSSTIDGLPYPVDSRFWAGSGRLLLAAFDTSHQQGVFSGLPMAATVETGDNQLTTGGRTLLRGLRPIVESVSGVTPSLTVGYRNHLYNSLTYGSSVPVNAYGFCTARVNARYHRARVTIPSGSNWQFARGVDDLKFSPTGRR